MRLRWIEIGGTVAWEGGWPGKEGGVKWGYCGFPSNFGLQEQELWHTIKLKNLEFFLLIGSHGWHSWNWKLQLGKKKDSRMAWEWDWNGIGMRLWTKLVFSHEVRGKLLEVTAECHWSVLHVVCDLQHTGDDVMNGGDLLANTIKLDTSLITHKILRREAIIQDFKERKQSQITREVLGHVSPLPSIT